MVRADTSTANGLTVQRELFASDNHRWTGIRTSVRNDRDTDFALTSMVPLLIRDPAAISVANAPFRDWRVVRMSRQKNDVPGCYRPSEPDDDYMFAAFQSGGIPAGMGIPDQSADDDEEELPFTVVSEPCICIKNKTDTTVPGLFLGMLGQHEHLTAIALTSTKDRNEFYEMAVVCEFDDVTVAPGETRASHWLLFSPADREPEKLDEFGAIMAEFFGARLTTKPRPVVYCSWQFYGNDFRTEDVRENLEELKKTPVPIDTILIDGGWMDYRGSYEAREEVFPEGMQHVADLIKTAGYEPGIWTAPFIVDEGAPLVKECPDLFARDKAGQLRTYQTSGHTSYVIDPSAPLAEDYFTRTYSKLRDWGFTYHKLDFLRAMITTDDIRFRDRTMNRAQAYRKALALVRKGMGDDAYMLACGGLFEASIGIPDGMRLGSDVKGAWRTKGVNKQSTIWAKMSHLTRIKQNVFRNYLNRFWHGDPDALMLRRRDEPFRGNEKARHLSCGLFTDEEAFTCVVNHYLGGGLVCISERFAELDEDRRALMRHVIPPAGPPARALDFWHAECPTQFVSEIVPACPTLGRWWTVAVANWMRNRSGRVVDLAEIGLPRELDLVAVFEFRTQQFLGILPVDEPIPLRLPPHGTRLLRITPWDGTHPVILGTNLHLSGGGIELADVEIRTEAIRGRIHTPWDYPVVITAAFPNGAEPIVRTATVQRASPAFVISKQD